MGWTPKALSKDAEAALSDLYLFLKDFWGLDLEEQPHREMCDAIQNGELDDTRPYAMLTVPRGSYKTSIGRGAVVWKQLRQIYLFKNYYHRIVLGSATLALAETSLRAIEGRIRHKDFESAYGKLFLDDRKKKLSSRHPDGLVLAPRLLAGEIAAVAEPSFWVGSERRVSTGFHADGGFFDDLNTRENVQTDHRRLNIQAYWELMFPILQRKDRGGRPTTILFTCTPWADSDVGGQIRRQERDRLELDPAYKSRWNILLRSAYLEDGSPWFPTVLTLEALEELRETLSTTRFAANYLCDPIGDSGFVEEDQILFMSRDKMPQPLRWLRATVDPSQHNQAKDLGCYTAIMVGGYDRFANLYILDARGSRDWDTGDTIDQFFQLNHDYQDIPILVEDAHMSHFRHAVQLEEEIRSKGGDRKHLRIQWVPVGSEAKYQKWEKLQPRFRSRRIFFAEEIEPKIKSEIREELVRGQAARFKDFLDTLAMMENGISPRVARDGQMMDQSGKLGKSMPDPNERSWASLDPSLEA